MAERNQEEEEGKIPLLTVLKNNAVLKNIFIVNKPPEGYSPRDHEDIFLVGRHPDCDLMLTHPSISRFHLHIRSTPSTLHFSVVDLSSVHGTWVSGRKIEAGVRVEMKEGDTLKLGVSSRVYRLHWIPISLAYYLENPFVPEVDKIMQEEAAVQLGGESVQEEHKNSNSGTIEMEEIETEDSILECIKSLFLDENVGLTAEEEILVAPQMLDDIVSLCSQVEMEEIQPVDSILECINSLFLDEDVELNVKEEIPVAPGMLEDIVALCCDEERKSPSKDETFGVPSDPFGTETSSYSSTNGENKLCDSQIQVLLPPYLESVVECDNTLFENNGEEDTFASPLQPDIENSFKKHCSRLLINTGDTTSFHERGAAETIISKESVFGCIVGNNGKVVRDNGRVADVLTARGGIFYSDNTFLPVEEVTPGTKFQEIKVIEEIGMDSLFDGEKQDTCGQRLSLNEIVKDIGNKFTASTCHISLQIESGNLSMTHEDHLNITKENQAIKPDMEILECIEAMDKNSTICNIWSRRGKATSAPQVRTIKNILKSTANVDATSNENDIINKAISKDLLYVLDGEEEEIFTPNKENLSPNTLQLQFPKKKGKQEDIKHSNSQRSHKKDNFNPDIYPDESITPTLSKKNQKDVFSVFVGEEEEIFTPDKENFSPNTLKMWLLKKKGKLEDIECSKSFGLNINPDESISPISNIECSKSFGLNINPDESISPISNKENHQTPKGAQDQKLQRKPFGSCIKLLQEHDVMALKNRVERIPFQSLKNTRSKGRSGISCPAKSIDVCKCRQILDMHIKPSDTIGVQKRSWNMIVDTTSLMNKESRKALQLLQGLKGTRLIIPRFVVRELHSMNQQFSIFRRISEASLALEWIEECMVKTNWWIHIHSSVEEGSLTAPTPPASPQTQFGEESLTLLGEIGSLRPVSPQSMEIPSPTVEDHILEFAVIYKRKQNNAQLVVLSEDVTLKIKCMAEGLLCEPVQEFRESLVNPFSERFLWANSSPRGQTWSCQDDVVLREKYLRLPLRKSSKGVASGLKLILLHNSQYGNTVQESLLNSYV